MRDDRPDLNCEISRLDDAAHQIVTDLVKGKYSFASILFFASKIQWYAFNLELIQNEIEVKSKDMGKLLEMMRGKQ